ncbi:MAG: hypothetical protein Q8905_17600, partial [Bacteroidota bacterium]|nr:hypothetical protein [Bacteroidota bacterium]
MKKVFAILFCMLLMTAASFGQGNGNEPKKTSQNDVLNDLSISYGFGSLYYLIENSNDPDYSINSPGSFILGYTRTLNKVIGVGFQLAYTPMSVDHNSGYINNETEKFNYVQALARVKFQYLNKPTFAMYSGIAIGITLDYHSKTTSGITKNDQKPVPAG